MLLSEMHQLADKYLAHEGQLADAARDQRGEGFNDGVVRGDHLAREFGCPDHIFPVRVSGFGVLARRSVADRSDCRNGIRDSEIHPLAADRRVAVSGVSRQQHTPLVVGHGLPDRNREGAGSPHVLDLKRFGHRGERVGRRGYDAGPHRFDGQDHDKAVVGLLRHDGDLPGIKGPGHIDVGNLVAIVEAYAKTVRSYGGAVVTLLNEMSRRPELRGANSVLVQNMKRAAEIIAIHQLHGRIVEGDPFHKAAYLIAPIMARGIWERSGSQVSSRAFDAEAVVNAFLRGHGQS